MAETHKYWCLYVALRPHTYRQHCTCLRLHGTNVEFACLPSCHFAFVIQTTLKTSTITYTSRVTKLYEWFGTNSTVSYLHESIYNFLHRTTFNKGTAVAQWLRCCATNQKDAGSIPSGVIGFFTDIKFFRSHYGPGVDSASNRNE